jgi:hypothetical protein
MLAGSLRFFYNEKTGIDASKDKALEMGKSSTTGTYTN